MIDIELNQQKSNKIRNDSWAGSIVYSYEKKEIIHNPTFVNQMRMDSVMQSDSSKGIFLMDFSFTCVSSVCSLGIN